MTQRALFKDGHLFAIGEVTEDDEAMADAAFDVDDDMEAWRLSVDEDNELVTRFDGESKEEALASLLAEQEAAEAEVEAARSGGE